MNRPCRIHFHHDDAPEQSQLPERYQRYVDNTDPGTGIVRSLLVQNAFPIDFAPSIIRTRMGRRQDPVDFPLASISLIEWFYEDAPSPLIPYTHEPKMIEAG